MELSPRLIATHVPKHPEGVVLLLHGGAARQASMMVSPTQLSVLRMIPIARLIARRGRRRVAVFRLLNSRRGWDAHHTPVKDASWALGELRERFGDLPVALVGHSLGGRAALLSGGQPGVVSVVALAAYLIPDQDRPDLVGRRVLFVHGLRDRIASPLAAERVARWIGRRTPVGFIRIPEGKHAMLRHGREYDGYAADFVLATLLEEQVGGPVARVLAGETWVDG